MKRVNRKNGQRGFTLVELMVVIVIIGLLAAAVLPRYIGQIGKAKRAKAQNQIRNFEVALEMYYADMYDYPTGDQGLQSLISSPGGASGRWRGPYLKKNKIPLDPWRNPYIYKSPGDHNPDYDIVSWGKDGVAGGTGENQDVNNWDLED